MYKVECENMIALIAVLMHTEIVIRQLFSHLKQFLYLSR